MMTEYPLTKANRISLARAFKHVPRVDLSIECAIEGMATILAGRLLQWCIENNAEANWDAANLESCGLAEKLGYIQTGEYLAYYLGAE